MTKRESKKGLNADDGRRRREQVVVAIRKDKKEENLSKRRNIAEVPNSNEQLFAIATNQAENPKVDVSKNFKVEDVPQLLAGLTSGVLAVQFESIRGFRKILSAEKNAPAQECINAGAIPHFVDFLQRVDCPDLQFEAAWALTNIASTDKTAIVVECGAVPHLIPLLSSHVPEIREQAAWCLGNVAGDSALFRDVVLNHGALNPLLANIVQPASVSLLRNCVWTLSNFCRGKPQPHLSVIAAALPVLQQVVSGSDQEAAIDATWALSYLSDGDNNRIQSVVNIGIIPALIQMLQNSRSVVVVPSLRTLGNIVSGNDAQTQAVVDANVVPILCQLLSHPKKNVRKETLWMLSNIAAGTPSQLAAVMNTPNAIALILDKMTENNDWDVRREATWAACNIITSGGVQQIMRLVECGIIRHLSNLLDITDVKMLQIVLEALESVLKVGASARKLDYTVLVDEAGGIDKLESLQEHENEEIYKKAVSIIEVYFGGDEDNEDQNNAPESNASGFTFGLNQGSGKTVFEFNSAAFGQASYSFK